ncbi:MAG: hypothetical protein WKF86_00685 [Acidimicrobiales bacterium]
MVAVCALVLIGLNSSAGSSAEEASDVTVTAQPRWGEVPPGAWTPYTVVVRNEGGVDITGEVVLRAQPEPPAQPGARPEVVTTSSTRPTFFAIGGQVVTAPLPAHRGASTTNPPWPSYRAPVSVPPATEKTLTVMVLQPEFGFGVELVAGGRVLAGAAGPVPAGKVRVAVLLLSDVTGADARLEALPPTPVVEGLDVIQLRAARDFPDLALHLAGLDAVALDDFDASTLSSRQHRALQDYVSLGGTLVLTGGAAWSRTLGSLPPGLVPLRASASATVPLGPLADLLAGTTTGAAKVATGELAAGRVVLGAPGGPPLVVESDYRAGRVIQLAYDPLAEPIASDQGLQSVAWDQAVARVADRWGARLTPEPPPPNSVPEDQLWAPTLEARPWPSWPLWAIGLLGVYCLVLGTATLLFSRRSGPLLGWAAVLLAVVATTGTCLVAARPRSAASETVVEVQTLGADGTVMSTAFRGSLDIDPPGTVSVPKGGASTVFSGRPVFRPIRGSQLDPLRVFGPDLGEGVSRGVGGGAVIAGERPAVRLGARRWELRTMQTVSVGGGGPAIEADLRIVGGRAPGAGGSRGRVSGTVPNRGSTPVRRLRAQTLEGPARLAEVLGPGETINVDAPVIIESFGWRDPEPVEVEEVAMFTAAKRSFSGPGQIALVGLTGTPAAGGARGRQGAGRHVRVVVTVVPVKAAETILVGSGAARLVSSTPALFGGATTGAAVRVLDLDAPAGAGPLTVRHQAVIDSPFFRSFPFSFEAYNWVTGTWRTLPPRDRPNSGYLDTPLDPAEVNNGLVRLRSQALDPRVPPTSAQLILTSSSTNTEALIREAESRRPVPRP